MSSAQGERKEAAVICFGSTLGSERLEGNEKRAIRNSIITYTPDGGN
jgi:hypothetical protein